MKYLLMFSCIFLFTISLSAQKTIPVLLNERSIGKNFKTGTDIRAVERTFPKSVQQVYVDTTTGKATVYLYNSDDSAAFRRVKKIIWYDLEKNTVSSIKKVNTSMGNFLQYNDIFIYSNGGLTYRLNPETGKNIWQNSNLTYYIDPVTETGIGYPVFHPEGNDRIEAVDLKTGRNLWYRSRINSEYGWTDLFPIGDSSIMLVAAGLHTIDLATGTGWDYNAITGSDDYTNTILANTAGVLLGALTGYYSVYYGHDIITDVASNVIFDDQNQAYFASKDKLACLSGFDGSVLWNAEFPKRMTSKSSLFLRDSLVYMVNFGYAYLNGNRKDFGRPFIAAFNRYNGTQAYLSEVSTKESRVLDFLVSENEIVVLFKDRIASYSINDGQMIKETTLNTTASGNLMSFCGDQYYMPFDSVYLSLTDHDPYNIYVFTDKKQVLTLDNAFSILNTTSENQYYTSYLEANGMLFIGKSRETIVIDLENRKIAEINISNKAFLMRNDLFDIQGRTLYQVDLTGLLEH